VGAADVGPDRHLAGMAWPDVAAAAAAGAVLVVPLGSCEQHGPHLPVTTDADVAVALTDGLAARRNDVVLAPVIPYGASGEHQAFAGTLSIGQAATELMLLELGRSAMGPFRRLLVVNGHGGNAEPVARAVAALRQEGRDVRSWAPRWGPDADAHAGRTETALQLHLRPSAVVRERAVRGDTRPLTELLPALRQGGVAAVSPSGVLGDPTEASAEEGAAMLQAAVDALVEVVTGWGVHDSDPATAPHPPPDPVAPHPPACGMRPVSAPQATTSPGWRVSR
jgi:creatinine amidohydrolase